MGDASAVRDLLRTAFAVDGPAALRRLRRLVALLAAGRVDAAALTHACRLAHTLKGAGSLLGAHALERAAHGAEDALAAIVPGRVPSGPAARALDRALTRLSRAVQAQVRPARAVSARQVELRSLRASLDDALRRWCRARGRVARLVLEGACTPVEVDLLGPVADALAQLLRNAVEHGLEAPAQRRRVGKPEAGRIVLQGRRDAGQLVLRVRDDGRGLDLARIARVARARGLLTAAADPGPRQAAQLVLQPGFSTRRRATAGAGRGMGLDLVRSLAGAAGGTLRLHPRGGRGLTVELRLTPR